MGVVLLTEEEAHAPRSLLALALTPVSRLLTALEGIDGILADILLKVGVPGTMTGVRGTLPASRHSDEQPKDDQSGGEVGFRGLGQMPEPWDDEATPTVNDQPGCTSQSVSSISGQYGNERVPAHSKNAGNSHCDLRPFSDQTVLTAGIPVPKSSELSS